MAKTCEFPLHFQRSNCSRLKIYWKSLIFLFAITLAAAAAPAARAQLQQPLVFSSSGAIAVRNDQTGVLTPVNGSPFAGTQSQFTMDVQGRFLFAPGTNSIHMYQITDATTGAYQEVAHSPFASANTKGPIFIAVEPTGQFIAVVNLTGQNPGEASVETFQISPTAAGGPALIPVLGSATELDSTPLGTAQPPDNKEFLIFMGPNAQSKNSTIQTGSEFQSLSIDPVTGFVTGLQANAASSEHGDSFAMDPQGRYYVLGTQDNVLEIGNLQISGIAGQFSSFTLPLPQHQFPDALWIDSTGSFLYAATSDLANPVVVNIYSVNLQNAHLTETTSSPLPGFTSVPAYFADSTGSFNYGFGADANTVTAYTVDPLTGYFIPSANSPMNISQIAGSLTFSIPPGQQGISGPSVLLSTASLSFGTIQTGSVSMPQTITLTSNGGEALSVNSISLSGADPSQFQETDTCQIPSVLQPSKFCSISITFAPTSTGSQQANLVITDNASGSPQSVQLSGAGSAPPPPAPQVTISPNPVNFPSTTQGTTSSAIVATVTNTGNYTLHISSVTLAGNNAADFSMTNACNGAYAPNSSCSITLTFTPLAAGQRTAAISISDDAQNSPQSLSVTGMGTPGQPTTPVVSLSSSSLGFVPVTQGTTSASQAVTLTNSGGAALHITSVVLGGANPGDFSMSNGCTASSYAINANCILTMTFAPLSPGARTATIAIADDASNSPQTISLNGTGVAAVTAGPAPGGSTTATVSAGQTATYNLQFTPGPGYSGAISLSCSGAPAQATCSVPASVQVSNGSPAPFTVTVSTTGGAILLVYEDAPRSVPFPCVPIALLSALAILLFFVIGFVERCQASSRPRRSSLLGAFACFVFLAVFASAGCGGGSASTPAPAAVKTPQGTSTITITPSATSASGKPLQLQPIQLTLTVQ